ncbi:hypothetical protein BD408DRAFT_451620 [Parasitella parasitica]|nr:hypothetical protein BD408DRAFT_451620 [Parasitella parasitica]
MTTDELAILIQSLQEQIKQGQEIENEKLAAIQLDNSNYGNTQARLETQLYAHEQDLGILRKEIQQLTKAKKDIEKKLSFELQVYETDKSLWQQKEADLYNQIRTLSLSNTGEPRTPRTTRKRSVTTTVMDSSYARETKIAQRTIKAQDKLIFDLKNEVEKLKSVIQEQKTELQDKSLHETHLQHEIASIKKLYQGLMEENESYQILLHEKTINGEFIMNPIMQVKFQYPAMKESISTSSNNQGLNLAAELASSVPDWNNQSDRTIQKLNEEIKTLQDTNRALQLYMNKILMKIINNKQLEDVLSIDQPTTPTNQKSSDLANNPAEGEGEGAGAGANSERGVGPTPTKTVSTVEPAANGAASKLLTSANRNRRRTISSWGFKPSYLPSIETLQEPSNLASSQEDKRRHSSIVTKGGPQPEASKSTSTSSNGSSSWAKALRRMSGMGWTPVKEEPETSAVVSSDSAVGSLSEEENAETTSRKSSGSSISSIRRSNELGTLSEE